MESDMDCALSSVDENAQHREIWLSLMMLPAAVIDEVVKFLPLLERVRLSSTCKRFRKQYSVARISEADLNLRQTLLQLYRYTLPADWTLSSMRITAEVMQIFKHCDIRSIRTLSFGTANPYDPSTAYMDLYVKTFEKWLPFLKGNRIHTLSFDHCRCSASLFIKIATAFKKVTTLRLSRRTVAMKQLDDLVSFIESATREADAPTIDECMAAAVGRGLSELEKKLMTCLGILFPKLEQVEFSH